jgi:transposase
LFLIDGYTCQKHLDCGHLSFQTIDLSADLFSVSRPRAAAPIQVIGLGVAEENQPAASGRGLPPRSLVRVENRGQPSASPPLKPIRKYEITDERGHLTRIARNQIQVGVDARSREDHRGAIMARSKTGEAISARRRSPSALKKLRKFIREREKAKDLEEWRRGRAVLGYINGRRVVDVAAECDVTRGAINRWLQWYEAMGIEGLRTGKPPGPAPKLSDEQREELGKLIDAGPLVAGYPSGVWTGPMIGDLIEQRFGVRYHKHNVPRLLHELGFSIQRPRKRLARASAQKQATWLRRTFPAIKKKLAPVAGS